MERDPYQKRYLAHQKRKQKEILAWKENKPFFPHPVEHYIGTMAIMKDRRSRRVYSGEKISETQMKFVKEYAGYAPSSCGRKAIKLAVSKRGIKTLVGGKNWIEKADKVILLYADMLAYKSPNEVDFMPYLDAGFVAQNIYLICEVLNIRCCFVNPNHTGTEIEKDGFRFCGAVALGK